MDIEELVKELAEGSLKEFVPYDEVYEAMSKVRADYIHLKLWEYVKKQTTARKEFIFGEGFELSEKKYKCPMYNQGICEKGIIPMCKFNDKRCFVSPLVYSLFLREKREDD